MDCPFCLEPVKPAALACKTCRRDLSAFKPLLEANGKLTKEVSRLEAELASLQKRLPRVSSPAAPAVARPLGATEAILVYVVLPVIALVALHYLLVIRLDARLLWLRVASIVLPAIFGFRLEAIHRPRWLLVVPMSLVVAVAAVLGMSLVVNLVDGDPLLPHSAVLWRETLEYVASITLAYLLGAVLCQALRPVRRRAGEAGLIERAAELVARLQGGGKERGTTFEQRLERMVKLINLGISAATAAGAVYTGLKAVIN